MLITHTHTIKTLYAPASSMAGHKKSIFLLLQYIINFSPYEFMRSRFFSDCCGQLSLGLNVLSSFIRNEQANYLFKLAANQDRHKLSEEFELLAIYSAFSFEFICP